MAALEMQNQQLTQNFQTFAVQQRENELTSILSRPDISEVVNSFDQRAGQPGAFRAEVIKRGQFYAYQSNQDVPPQQLVDELVSLVGMPQGTQQSAPTQTQPQAQAPKPVLPNVAGKGTSPVKRIAKSTDDLRQLAAQMATQ